MNRGYFLPNLLSCVSSRPINGTGGNKRKASYKNGEPNNDGIQVIYFVFFVFIGFKQRKRGSTVLCRTLTIVYYSKTSLRPFLNAEFYMHRMQFK